MEMFILLKCCGALMGIKILVDDLRSAPDSSWTVVRTITEAIRILATQEVEEVLLDHDIAQVIPVAKLVEMLKACAGQDELNLPPGIVSAVRLGMTLPFADKYSEETFESVARYIAAMPKPPKVGFITANPAGRARMQAILADGERLRRERQ